MIFVFMSGMAVGALALMCFAIIYNSGDDEE